MGYYAGCNEGREGYRQIGFSWKWCSLIVVIKVNKVSTGNLKSAFFSTDGNLCTSDQKVFGMPSGL